jgi:hypothetical protein
MGGVYEHPSARIGSVRAMELERLHKGSSNLPFSLPSSPWPGEATMYLVHFVVWAAIGGSFFFILVVIMQIIFSPLSLQKTISRLLQLRLQ